ncbi:hypothetical protein J4E93_002029 [Alternaria ventricosa]|uniref:uncharacterized protein n=1 Tax=Alternaria ventricosa TaxID=1187951 RepID=UPI0020C40381|nr:uncharacterized protein J4E93_002029 [Alternaria ventricosa]KAI4651833.1 hypothetical protein J4E93_002029 [Alternaria ventricosa]
MAVRRTVAFATQTLTITVPKNRRPKFDLHLRIIDLNNVPLVSGTSFIKWHLSHSTAAEHRGRTDSCQVKDHKVAYNYDITLPVRLTVDKNGMLQECYVELEVVQEYGRGSGRGERITLGTVKLNLAEYVEQSEMATIAGEEPGVTRRYLMQDSKINSTLKVGIYMKQTEGDKNFVAPALKTAQVFSGIAGIMAGEQAELEDHGAAPSLTSKSREAGELQDMYRRTLAAYWSAQPGELKADECIEDIFAGGDGWGDREKPYSQQPRAQPLRFAGGDSSSSVSESEHGHMRGGSSAHHEQQPPLKITKQVTPINRLRKRKGEKILRETSQDLGVKRLGDDADILVLREVGEPAQREATTTTEASEDAEVIEISEPLEVPDILASLEEEGKALAPEEIYKQIETLRPNNDGDPNEPHHVKQTTFVKLRKKLMKGFTQQQLIIFYSVAKNIRQEKVNQGVIDSIKRKDQLGNQKQPVERSEWQPGTTPITQRLPGVDRIVKIMGYRKNVSKQLLVDRIMRDVWNLVLLEEIESPGELELSLQPWQVVLLKAGDKDTLFDKIRRTRRVRLDMYKPDNALRITSDKTTAEYAANDIEEAFQHTELKRMNLNNYLRQLANGPVALDSKSNLVTLFYTQKDFDVVSALTRTSIEAVGKSMLVIRGFDVSSIEEAKRTLVRFLPFKDAAERTFDTQKLGSAESAAFLSPVLTEHDSFEYKYRKRELGRLSMPIMRLTEPDTVEAQAAKPAKAPKTTLHGLVNRTLGTILRPASAVPLPKHELSNWIPNPTYEVSAEFGQALFPLEDVDPSRVVEAALSDPSKAPFLSTFPGLNSVFTSPNYSVVSRLQAPSLHYEFRPDLEHEPGQILPKLRIQMRTGRSGARATFRKLALSFDHRIHDVLLPDKAVDVRFQRRANLSFNNREYNDENVQAWVDAVTDNIESGGRLTAPPLRIQIPKWTIPGFPSEEKGMRTVTYHFSGIQFRQPVIGDLFGVAVSYNTVQSGKLGAKGSALTAHYSGHGDTELRDESAMKAFVERCFKMADLITDASKQTLPPSRLVRPRDMNSERKAKRMALSGDRAQAVDEQSVEPANDLVERVGEYPDVKDDAEAEGNAAAGKDVAEEQPVDGEMESRSDDSVAESEDNVRTL